jgi:hypothetical protein
MHNSGETVKRKQPSEASISEHDIQGQILEYLTIKRIFHWRNNTGAFKKGKHFVRFGTPGSADVFACVSGHLFGIEVKRPGGTLSDAQVAFCAALRAAGGTYLVATKLEHVTSWFEAVPHAYQSLSEQRTKPLRD